MSDTKHTPESEIRELLDAIHHGREQRRAWEHTYAKGINPEAVPMMREALLLAQDVLVTLKRRGGATERAYKAVVAAIAKAEEV